MIKDFERDELRQQALAEIADREQRLLVLGGRASGKASLARNLLEQMDSNADALEELRKLPGVISVDEVFVDEMHQADMEDFAPLSKGKGRTDSIKSKKAAERRKNVRKAQKRARKCK